MTEQEWLACADPEPMLEFLTNKVRDRKLRLFAAAYCYRIWHFLPDELCRSGVQVAERFADRAISRDEFEQAGEVVEEAAWADADRRRNHRGGVATPSQSGHAYEAVGTAFFSEDVTFYKVHVTLTVGSFSAAVAEGWGSDGRDVKAEARAKQGQSDLLRDIFNSPFRPAPNLDPTWLRWNDGTVAKLAQGIYEERAFDRLPVLADALEEAGCTNADILTHLRCDGPHVRGCWPVDLILGKS